MELAAIAGKIREAASTANLSQRALAQATGISQSTLSRIMSGERPAKMPDILLIADATGHSVAELTGVGSVAERVQYAARATGGAEMAEMRRELLRFLDLDAYLDDQGLPSLPVVE
ncbi:helix-turn-helix transcriptional regulator [Pseudofrankia sp. DC12]|uniref:helix-turn-helix domain-containing protein n=1 Tax=Pseudofrankia sp. DC12 TaxID=683315 RepID=UPI000AE12F36|nr:helix-turn-helix transcriptional regulator [Pseudofrankia sp. DC12]